MSLKTESVGFELLAAKKTSPKTFSGRWSCSGSRTSALFYWLKSSASLNEGELQHKQKVCHGEGRTRRVTTFISKTGTKIQTVASQTSDVFFFYCCSFFCRIQLINWKKSILKSEEKLIVLIFLKQFLCPAFWSKAAQQRILLLKGQFTPTVVLLII